MGSLAEARPRAAYLADVLKALAHPTRLRIVAALCEGEESVIGLAERLGLPQAIVSQQLRILRMCGLVTVVRTGGFACYSLAQPRLRELVTCLEGCHTETAGASRARKEGERKMSVDVDKAIAELKTKVDGMPGAENKLTMIVFSGDLDKQLAAMIIATGAAAMGMKVVLFFTFWGTAALRAPQKKVGGKNLMAKMFGMMLPKGRNKLTLSQMHMAGMGTAMLKGLMQKKNVASMDQLYDVAAELAVKIYVCEMSMDLMGFKKEEMIDYPGLEVCGVATMLSHAKESSIQFFI